MPNLILPILLLSLPITAAAECGIAATESGMSIVVHSKSANCFSSAQFREAFKEMLQESIRVMEAGHASRAADMKATAASAVRRPPPAHLRQDGSLNAPYYGQK